MADISKWYVVHTYSGYENKVASNIETVVENRKIHDQILEVKVPTETVTEIRDDGTKKEVERKIFPGYVLVKVAVYEDEDSDELQMNDDTWYVIRNTRGVTGFDDLFAAETRDEEGVDRAHAPVAGRRAGTVRIDFIEQPA